MVDTWKEVAFKDEVAALGTATPSAEQLAAQADQRLHGRACKDFCSNGFIVPCDATIQMVVLQALEMRLMRL